MIFEDGRFISSKSGIDPSRNHGATGVPKKVRTDRQLGYLDKLNIVMLANTKIDFNLLKLKAIIWICD